MRSGRSSERVGTVFEGRDEESGKRGKGIPVMSGQAHARCEKGSVVSASRFRPVIGSDSMLTLNASPRYTRAQRGRQGGRRAGEDFRDGRCRSLPSPVLSSIIYDRA